MSIRVFIAEPDISLLELYHEFLTKNGFVVTTTHQGSDCFPLLSHFHPDVLLLEPDRDDGWREKLLPQMRADPVLSHIPVVILTRHDQGAYEIPVREYLVKPVSMSRLSKAIARSVLSGSNGQRGRH